MKVQIRSLDAKAVGDVELKADIFGLPVRKDILQRMVEWQRAKKQAGTHKTKTISEISGSTAKPYKQKGTGRARQGSKRSSQFRGGQTVFGPVVRSHAHKLTKKFRVLGLKTALSAKFNEASVFILDDIQMDSVKTAELGKRFQQLGFSKPLVIDVQPNENFKKSASNLKHVDVLPVVGINVLDILRHKELVLTKSALVSIEERLS